MAQRRRRKGGFGAITPPDLGISDRTVLDHARNGSVAYLQLRLAHSKISSGMRNIRIELIVAG